MNLHPHHLIERIRRKAEQSPCRFRVVAVGLDDRGTFIGMAVNLPRFDRPGASYHAEERLIHQSPPSLSRILIARIGASGDFLPIDPCERCRKLADKHDVKIDRLPR